MGDCQGQGSQINTEGHCSQRPWGSLWLRGGVEEPALVGVLAGQARVHLGDKHHH